MNIVTRVHVEQRERMTLSPEAAHSADTHGRLRHEEPDVYRTCWQQDRDRILHSKSFRRLANKTQVFIAPEGDHFRTRLTHTLEVAQISCAIARSLALNVDLTEAIALGHDLGHTPFGHAGERALRDAMASLRNANTTAYAHATPLFRHNRQSVRIVELLEREGSGLNLTREVIDGMLCHTHGLRAQTLEGRVVACADRIAYVCHDIDDAKRAGLLREDDLPVEACEVLGSSSSERIETMIHDMVLTSAGVGDIKLSEPVHAALMELRSFLYKNLYRAGDARTEEPKAELVVRSLFSYYYAHMNEVPFEYRLHDDAPDVQVADYVSSMTDRYAIRRYEELFVPKAWGMRR